jgi:hypothetical protein
MRVALTMRMSVSMTMPAAAVPVMSVLVPGCDRKVEQVQCYRE